MKLTRLLISIVLAALSVASTAQSQDLMGFDRASFGSVVLSRTQAVGTDIQLELSVGSYENEPISNYKGTIFADIGKSVGRLNRQRRISLHCIHRIQEVYSDKLPL